MSEPVNEERQEPRRSAPSRPWTLRGSSAQGLGPAGAILALYLAVGAVYWPSAAALNAIWTNSKKETYTHGYLVLLLSVWLIFRNRKRLVAVPATPASGALLALGVLSALWVWAWRAAIQEVHLVLLPLLLITAIAAAFGWRSARAAAFPVGYLYFAMPIWGNINGIVRAASASATGALVWITGLPAYLDGDYIHLPGGTIEIANSCSGLHALIVGLALAALYGEVNDDSPRRRIEWLVVMGGLSVIVNWVRIFIVISAAYATDMRSSLVKSHYWLGWWLFAGAFGIFLWWAERRNHAKPSPSAVHRPGSAQPTDPIRRASALQIVLALAVLAAPPASSYAMDWADSGSRAPVSVQWPNAPAGWRGPFAARSIRWAPRYTHSSGQSLRLYVSPHGRRLEAFSVVYRTQTQQGKLLGYHNTLLGDDRRLRIESTDIVESPDGPWRESRVIDPTGARSVLWSRYDIGHRSFVNPRLSQLWYGLAALIHPPLSSLVALRTPCVPDCVTAEQRLRIASAHLRPIFR